MIMGPLGGYLIKKIDQLFKDRIKSGFEMLVNNFTAGILGAILVVIAFYAIGPVVLGLNKALCGRCRYHCQCSFTTAGKHLH